MSLSKASSMSCKLIKILSRRSRLLQKGRNFSSAAAPATTDSGNLTSVGTSSSTSKNVALNYSNNSSGSYSSSAILHQFSENANAELPALLDTLRQLGKSTSGMLDTNSQYYADINASSSSDSSGSGSSQQQGQGPVLIVEHPLFSQLLSKLQTKLIPNADAKSLAYAIDGVARFRHRTPALDDFTFSLATEVKRRPNAWSPKLLAQIGLGFSARQLTEPDLVEFVRREALKVCQDIEPGQAISLLEAFRRWGLFDRELVDILVERMTDEVDRFSSRDIVDALRVLSDLGLARGFLLRRLAQLAFENLHVFTMKQLTGMLYALARLRFVVAANAEDVLDHIRDEITENRVRLPCISRLCFSLAMLQPEYEDHALMLSLFNKFLDTHRSNSCYLIHLVDVAWSICRYKHLIVNNSKENSTEYSNNLQSKVLDLFKRLYSLPVTRNRVLLAKVFEVNNSIEYEDWGGPGKKSPINASIIDKQWKAACEESDQLSQGKTENSRLHQELLLKIEQTMKMRKYHRAKLSLQLQQNASVGPFRADLSDAETKIVIDIDAPNRPVNRAVKHRILSNLKSSSGGSGGSGSWKTTSINYWRWRQCKTDEEQSKLCETVLDGALGFEGEERVSKSSG